MRIKYTGESNPGYTRLTGRERVTFNPDDTVDVSPERAHRLVEMYPRVEYANTIPRDWNEMQKLAAAADTDEVNGNSSKVEVAAYLESLDPTELEELKTRIE